MAEGARFCVGSATAFAVRRESKDIALRIRRERRPFRDMLERLPFVRGMHRLVGSVAGLLDGISESAELEPQRIAKGTRFEQAFARMFRIHPESLVAFTSAVLIPIILIGLIYALPRAAQVWLLPNFDLTRAGFNAIVCFGRIWARGWGCSCAGIFAASSGCACTGAPSTRCSTPRRRPRREPTLAEVLEASRIYHQERRAFPHPGGASVHRGLRADPHLHPAGAGAGARAGGAGDRRRRQRAHPGPGAHEARPIR